MEASHLIWTEIDKKEVYRSRVLSVWDARCRSPEGKTGVFTIIDSSDWVIVVPVIKTRRGPQFLMVRQWRHGSRELSLEFPGGVLEKGEDSEAGAARELEEETAHRAGRLTVLGTMSPNPAIMSNRVHFYYAEDLVPLEGQNLDEDEFLDAEFIPPGELIRGMGKPPYVHALTAAALALYLGR
ncbi:MAG: NUDIX hydrolase [Spirochaetaceae bacterium]|jgi:8-oxo-dGTP pyrophosphatase MutT (NUDIX family)|nr:NUDIX hydrolase [Spirochaetaceae bacterium]